MGEGELGLLLFIYLYIYSMNRSDVCLSGLSILFQLLIYSILSFSSSEPTPLTVPLVGSHLIDIRVILILNLHLSVPITFVLDIHRAGSTSPTDFRLCHTNAHPLV